MCIRDSAGTLGSLWIVRVVDVLHDEVQFRATFVPTNCLCRGPIECDLDVTDFSYPALMQDGGLRLPHVWATHTAMFPMAVTRDERVSSGEERGEVCTSPGEPLTGSCSGATEGYGEFLTVEPLPRCKHQHRSVFFIQCGER